MPFEGCWNQVVFECSSEAGARILDLGCGSGVPITQAVVAAVGHPLRTHQGDARPLAL
jgi:hypothetical protein